MRQKFNLITLGVSDFEKSLHFYEQGLGWKKSDKSMDGLALFPLGGITLALHPRHELEEDTTLKYSAAEFSGLTISYNAKSEKEVDEVMKKVESIGGKIVKPAQKVFWGGYSGYYKDLDGYLFEVAYNPFWPLDENDNLVL
jgi:predicted lactoylglutathione lyase